MKSLCETVLYKVLKLKVEIDFALFLTLNLRNLVAISKAFMKTCYCFKNHFEILDILSERGFVLRFFEAIIKLQSNDV